MDFELKTVAGKRILYVMAVDAEYGVHLRAHIDPLMTGVGPVEAAVVLAATLARLEASGHKPDLIVSLGSAGSATLEQTEVYQATSVSYRDMDASALGFEKGLTPFLDSIAAAAWSFDNIWSAGIHTYNGIYSTLTGHPALMKKHPMEQVHVPRIDGLPVMLRRQGYQTLFFTTHDELFDNMSGFLSANGIDRIIGQKDYPAREVKSTMGVPDEFMFRFAIGRLK